MRRATSMRFAPPCFIGGGGGGCPPRPPPPPPRPTPPFPRPLPPPPLPPAPLRYGDHGLPCGERGLIHAFLGLEAGDGHRLVGQPDSLLVAEGQGVLHPPLVVALREVLAGVGAGALRG